MGTLFRRKAISCHQHRTDDGGLWHGKAGHRLSATQQNLLAESYYGLTAGTANRDRSGRNLQGTARNIMRMHLKLEAAGMIDKAGRLFAQVNMDEAKRTLDAARKDETVVQNALKGITE